MRNDAPVYLSGGRGFIVNPDHSFARDENYLISEAMVLISGLPMAAGQLETKMRQLAESRRAARGVETK